MSDNVAAVSKGVLTGALKAAIAKGFVGDREALEEAALNGYLPIVEYFHQQGIMLNNYDSLRRIFLHASAQGCEDMLEHLFTIYDISDTLILLATAEAMKIPSTVFYLLKKRERKPNEGELSYLLYKAITQDAPPLVVKLLLRMGAVPGREAVKVIVEDDLDIFILIYEMSEGFIHTTEETWGKKIREFLRDIVGEGTYHYLPLPRTPLNVLISSYL